MARWAFVALPLLAGASLAAQTPGPRGSEVEQVRRRAAEAVIWAMPAVNTDLMLQAALRAGAKENEVVYWSRQPDWRNQTLTPNPDAIYLMPFFDTREGPVVLEFPAASAEGSITGNIDDIWQMPLEDVGPSGADKGAGGKFLLLPPGYTEPVPSGYFTLPMVTYSGYALIRSTLASHSDADVVRAVAYGRKLKIYRLADAASPPPTRFTDASGQMFDSTIPYDLRFFESLHRIVQEEPWLMRDMAMVDPLRTLGIEKGKPFAPDSATRDALAAGIADAHAWLDGRVEAAFEPYYPGAHWVIPASPQMLQAASNGYADPQLYPIDARAVTYSMGYVGIKRLGTGQSYLMTSRDSTGAALDGGKSYRLRVPGNAPVRQYWSVTAYSRRTHGLITEVPHASRSSQVAEMRKNSDGSVDVFFGPEAPAGQADNWVPTKRGEPFELLFRLYAPTQPLFDKTWVLPDLEQVTD